MQENNIKNDLSPNQCSFIQIYYDCKTIISLFDSIRDNSIACMALIPYISLFCWEAIAFLKKIGIKINIEENETFSLKDVRLKLKIFENEYSKAKNMILNCDYLQDYIFKNKLKSNLKKDWNIYYNLGIIFDEKKDIVGNSQYGYYIFQDTKLLKKKLAYIKKLVDTREIKYDYVPEEYLEYGKYCGEIIGSISNCFEILNITNIHIKTNEVNIKMKYKDFNTNKLYKSKEEKALTLYLLHILTFINSTIKMLSRCEKDDCGWWLRVYYIAYYYTIKRLEDIKNQLENNNTENIELMKMLNRLDFDNSLINTEFRNCMMHYGLVDKENNFLINSNTFNLNIPMFGLVESCFDNLNYFELKKIIKEKLENISTEIDVVLNIDKSKLDIF